ncbi:hypothetical protein EJ05DRAFT_461532 [Pseudovirgaria hyperparasitica]|uniref:Histone transcription regulator 3 homolog n=1 Tax=Pseudovirgaria hyperparasitica TaxID=470096 RepID=A0A6A6WG55_9PEZI|nr:uncharacterized protein EJ05DRAFT_461532 [Pseudovirgaria hyperparasitica]KAF2760926.1 hypothetical protein EJ05DRAFT_461532 [Pseudovirgaria hyperparasitica]
MATFKALNLESDSESDDEVDNTKEIQIEEALKLYQNALKYHSEGPQSYDKAKEAYASLFNSEVFKYPESLSEYRRSELLGDQFDFEYALPDDVEAGPVALPAPSDSAPNTLPQILHLSNKNHGQLLMDILVQRHREWTARPREEQDQFKVEDLALNLINAAVIALDYFANALDKDDADIGLWSRTASVAEVIGSKRLARFCIEAVLDGDDEGLEGILRLPGLQETRAMQQLKELAEVVEDDLSVLQPPLSSWQRKSLSSALKQRLVTHTYPQLSTIASSASKLKSLEMVTGSSPQDQTLSPAKEDWGAVGESILQTYVSEQNGVTKSSHGAAIRLAVKETDVKFLPQHEAKENELIHSEPSPTPVARKSPSDEDLGRTQDANDNAMEEPPQESAEPPSTIDAGTGEISTLPSRKRSTESAGLPETAEGGRGRSKRLRARETVTESQQVPDQASTEIAKQITNQLWNYEQADHYLFTIAGDLFRHIDVDAFGTSASLRDVLKNELPTTLSSDGERLSYAMQDLHTVLQACTPKTTRLFRHGESVDTLSGMSREAGLNAFLGNARSTVSPKNSKPMLDRTEGLCSWMDEINTSWLSIKQVALRWLKCFLMPQSFPSTTSSHIFQSSYMSHKWPEDVKRTIVQVLVHLDECIYEDALDLLSTLNASLLGSDESMNKYEFSEFDAALVEYIETLFELHLDVYSLIKNSTVDTTTQVLQHDRLEKWALLARDALSLRRDGVPTTNMDDLSLRHIWASAFHISVCDGVLQQHVVRCIEDVKDTLAALNDHVIIVTNNAIMPELSLSAADRELAKINMKDFFLKVFDHDEKDPVAVIESLEPIVEPSELIDVKRTVGPNTQNEYDGDVTMEEPDKVEGDVPDISTKGINPGRNVSLTPYTEMRKFLENASLSLRLSLWQRLREAYQSIEYYPKVMSCYLRSIELISNNFKSVIYTESQEDQRQFMLLSGIRILDEILFKIMTLINKGNFDPFECLDETHLKSSANAIAEILRLLTVSDVYEDRIRVGQVPVSTTQGRGNADYNMISARIKDMHVRAWTLQYLLLKEGMKQNPDKYPTADDDRLDFLRHIHYAMGLRQYGHMANKVFLKLLKDELVHLNDVSDKKARDAELCQTLYDIYGLKCFTKAEDSMEYGSPEEPLDAKTATQLLPFVMAQAHKISVKDLPKTEHKAAIDKLHGALGRPKANGDMMMNRKVITSYLKSPINPLNCFRCLHGVGALSTKHISPNRAIAASKGWYFLMGNIALNKFRSQKRIAQGPTEEINFAAAFFMQDLEYSIERWETWYRLAQTYDTQLEESVSWSAEKLNGDQYDIIQLQRNAVHCYTMAVACANRQVDITEEDKTTMAEMYADFGMRMYSSSRPPYSSKAFDFRESETRFLSRNVVQQEAPYESFKEFTLWKFSKTLFIRAIRGNPDRWMDHFMLGKCLWKMYNCTTRNHIDNAPTIEQIVNAFVNAIDRLPGKKDSKREPVLEPHYKLVSIINKLVHDKSLGHESACEALQSTRYARTLGKSQDLDDWQSYVLQILKQLRSADKSGWHHRMTARAAHVVYDDDKSSIMAAMGAKHELTQQIFTKTMAVQVWKPENERPGRHFVYTTLYTDFFLQLLVQLNERSSLEALAKRVRKRPHDFFEHSKLWYKICVEYIKLLRRHAKVPEGHEDIIFKSLSSEEFAVKADRLEQWLLTADSSMPVIEVLREAVEFKKLNSGLAKYALIDDTVGDAYAVLYADIALTLPPLPSETPSLPLNATATPFSGGQAPERTNMMSLTSLMNMANSDKATIGGVGVVMNAAASSTVTTEPVLARPRFKAVNRREIARRAEAAVARLTTLQTAAKTPVLPQGDHTVEVVIRSPVHDRRKSFGPSGDNTLSAPDRDDEGAEVSAPGSVHDSADDESELTQLEDDDDEDDEDDDTEPRPPKSMFPNLFRKDHLAADDTGASSVASPEAVTADEGHPDEGDEDVEDIDDEVFEEAEEEQLQADDDGPEKIADDHD